MNEGWSDDEHYILFDDGEARAATDRYHLPSSLPGFTVVGLKGWDDFILRDSAGHLFTLPTVPIIAQHLQRLGGDLPTTLLPAAENAGKIKWYITPIVFGGPPASAANIAWVDHATHAELVRWWNEKFQQATGLAV